jgi:hypothetical protein
VPTPEETVKEHLTQSDADLEVTHFALLVPSIARAVATQSELLGLAFCEAHVAPFARVDHYGNSGPVDVPMTYSMAGPPYVEILQATGEGLWSSERGYGVHHVGGFAVEFAATVKRYEALGLPREATIFAGNGEPIIAFFSPSQPGGVRLEVLSPVLRPSWTEWVGGGPPPGHGPPAE